MKSYYELLEMIKAGIIPKTVYLKINGYLRDYEEYIASFDGSRFSHYEIKNKRHEDEDIRFYLNENFLDSDMFDEKIKIELGDISKKIERLDIIQEQNIKNNWKWRVFGNGNYYNISTPQKIIADKVNEIIDYLKSKGE